MSHAHHATCIQHAVCRVKARVVDPKAAVEEAATDGGETGLGLEGPPDDVDDAGDDQEDDVVDDDQEESDDLEECPRCGAEHDTSDLSPGTYRCDECGGRVRVTA